MIGVTQPRRVAAVSMARRVAEELSTACGKEGEAEMKWGWWAFVTRSNFKMMFQRTMEAMEARCRLDSFSGSVMQIHKDELLSFVFELHKSIQELYTELIPESS